MKLAAAISASLLVISCMSTAWGAAPPPSLDRPTPPACCADGYCYPNPTTFGWYARRWRRWPTEALVPTPAGVTPPARLTPDIPPFDLPPVEEEDRRAPPPTQPPEPAEGQEGEAAPGAPETPRAVPPTPTPAPGTTPPMRLLPFEDDEPGTESPGLPFGQPAVPSPTGPPPLGQPTGDLDLPPAPPQFGRPSSSAPKTAEGPATRTANRSLRESARPTAAPTRRVPSTDPPPALPLSIAKAAF